MPYRAIPEIPPQQYLVNYTNAGTRRWLSLITESARRRQGVNMLLDSFIERNPFESCFC